MGGRDGEIMIWRKWDVVVGDVEVLKSFGKVSV